MENVQLATLCYLKQDGKTLMMHRNKKPGDMHAGKWNAVGGKFSPGETPEQCAIREIKEETGYNVEKLELKGFLTFPNFKGEENWYVFVFLITEFSGTIQECPEGDLKWIEDEKLCDLELWEGDRIFFEWLKKDPFFSGRFVYSQGKLMEHSVEFYGK